MLKAPIRIVPFTAGGVSITVGVGVQVSSRVGLAVGEGVVCPGVQGRSDIVIVGAETLTVHPAVQVMRRMSTAQVDNARENGSRVIVSHYAVQQ